LVITSKLVALRFLYFETKSTVIQNCAMECTQHKTQYLQYSIVTNYNKCAKKLV